jgi:membrane associated rhomboid family serine protease
VCRNCGALVGAGEQECTQCGAPLAATTLERNATERSPYERDARRFALAVLNRPSFFTIIFLVSNIFVFMLMWASSESGSSLWEFSGPLLQAYGAKLNYLIKDNHEWWRFVTPIFIHVSLPHLLINMYTLWMIGPYVEKLYGSAKYVVFWVVSGIAGVVASYLTVRPEMHVGSVGRFLFKAADNPSAGASGALFGLVGVLFVFGIKFRHELPDGFKRAFGTGLLPMIALNLFIGFLGRGFIDNAAHLGGLMAGALLALFVSYKRPHESAEVAVFWHILQVAALALVLLSFFMVWRTYSGPPPDFKNVTALPQSAQGDSSSAFGSNLNAINEAQRAFVNAVNKGEAADLDRALAGLDAAPHLDDETDALRTELKSLLSRAKEFTSQTEPPRPTRQQQLARAREQQKLSTDFVAWNKKYQEWAETVSRKYGVKLKEPEPATDNSSNGK